MRLNLVAEFSYTLANNSTLEDFCPLTLLLLRRCLLEFFIYSRLLFDDSVRVKKGLYSS